MEVKNTKAVIPTKTAAQGIRTGLELTGVHQVLGRLQ